MAQTITCKNCKNQFVGKFCNQCGEKVYNEENKKIRNIFGEVFHFVTHFDGTFLTSFKTSLTKPGKLSVDFCNGIRKKYFKPIPFFLLIVVLYLLFPKFKGLNMNADTYVSEQYGFSWLSIPVFKAKMKKYGVTYEEMAHRYDGRSPKVSKFSLLLLIPLAAGVLALLNLNKRKPFYDHFILAAEMISFFIFLQFLALPFINFLVEKVHPPAISVFYDGSWVNWITQIISALFVIIAVRNFYQEKYWLSILKGLLFYIVFVVGIKYIYSVVVFLVTMLFI